MEYLIALTSAFRGFAIARLAVLFSLARAITCQSLASGCAVQGVTICNVLNSFNSKLLVFFRSLSRESHRPHLSEASDVKKIGNRIYNIHYDLSKHQCRYRSLYNLSHM